MGDKTRGLYRKYRVERTDGSSEPGGKHHECEYFVLDLTHDKHAKAALLAYAKSCKSEYPLLAHDLRATAILAPAPSERTEAALKPPLPGHGQYCVCDKCMAYYAPKAETAAPEKGEPMFNYNGDLVGYKTSGEVKSP